MYIDSKALYPHTLLTHQAGGAHFFTVQSGFIACDLMVILLPAIASFSIPWCPVVKLQVLGSSTKPTGLHLNHCYNLSYQIIMGGWDCLPFPWCICVCMCGRMCTWRVAKQVYILRACRLGLMCLDSSHLFSYLPAVENVFFLCCFAGFSLSNFLLKLV